jgi:hypothetical protein
MSQEGVCSFWRYYHTTTPAFAFVVDVLEYFLL